MISWQVKWLWEKNWEIVKMHLRKLDFMTGILAAAVAALLAALAFATLTPLDEAQRISACLESLIVYFPFCFIGEIVLGMPLFILLVKMNMIRWWIWLPLAIILGTGLGVFFVGTAIWNRETFTATITVSLLSTVIFRLAFALSRRCRAGK